MAQRSVSFSAPDSGSGSGSTASRISVTSRSGSVEVFAEARADIRVDGARRAAQERDDAGEHIVAEGSSDHIVVRCPLGTDVFVGSLSGRVELAGRLGVVKVTTSSGRIAVAGAASVDVRTRSGRIDIGRCEGAVRARSTNARVIVEAADEVEVSTASGAIIAESTRDASVRTTSGRVELGLRGQGAVAVRTVSGRVEISLPAGSRPELLLRTISGRVDSSVETGHDGTVGVKTISGRIQVRAR